MKKSNLLSAVMLSISAIHSVAPMAASASPMESKGVSGGGADNVPAVLKFQAEHKRMEPERLREYERALAEATGFILAQPNRADDLSLRKDDAGQCGTVSGSADGWDDSRLDC